jgi:hypothetical protein
LLGRSEQPAATSIPAIVRMNTARTTVRGRRAPGSRGHRTCSQSVTHRPLWPVNAVLDGLDVLYITELAGNVNLRPND